MKKILLILMFIILSSVSYAAIDDYFAYYKFESGMTDETTNWDMTNSGITFVSGGADGNMGEIEQTDSDSASVADGGAGTNMDLTASDACWSFWISYEGINDADRILRKSSAGSNGWSIQLRTNAAVAECNSDACVCFIAEGLNRECEGTGTAIAGGGALTHIVVSHDGESAYFYTNGTLNQASPYGATKEILESTGATYLGQNGLSTEYFDGQLDELKIFNHNCTDADAQALYDEFAGGAPPTNQTPTNPIFNWDFTFNITSNITNYENLNVSSNPINISYNGSTNYVYNIPNTYAHWNFDANNANDYNRNFNGTVNGATWTASGKYGGGFEFDGLNDYINISQELSNINLQNKNFSISLWVKRVGLGTKQSLISTANFDTNPFGGGGWRLYFDTSNNLNFVVLQNETGSTDFDGIASAFPTGTNWSHIITTYNLGEYPKMYINGIRANVANESNDGVTNYSSDYPIYIGASFTVALVNYYDGFMDDVRIYNRSLSGAEASHLYNSSVSKFSCNLYDNGVITDSQNNVSLNATNNLMFSLDTSGMQSQHNLTLTCSDTLLSDSRSANNVFIDVVTPIINLLSPANNTIYYKGFDTQINITAFCDDPNLFSCNVSLSMLNGGVINQTMNVTFYDNIATTNQTASILRSVTSTGIGNYTFIVESADSHTTNKIKDYKLDKITDGYLIEDKIKITSSDLNNFMLNKEKDRYTFDMEFNKANPEIYVECEGDITYLKDSDYNGHLVCFSERKWIDFENDKGSEVLIQKVSRNKVKITPLSSEKKFKFKSIGDLNINKQIYYLSVEQNSFAFQMTIYDEDNPTQTLIGSAEVEFNYYAGASTNLTNYYADLSGSDTYAFNISTNESTVRGDLYIKYTTTNGFTHRYILVNTTFNTTTGYNFTLYNFNTTTGISDLKITSRVNSNYNYYPDVIAKLQRRYTSEGLWRTVQYDQSGDFGVLFFNVREETTDYRIIFIDLNNNILKTTDSLKFICTSAFCDLTTLLDPYTAASISANIAASYIYNNNTNILNFTWTDADGGTNTVNMRVRQETITGAIYPCDTTQVGAAGVLACNLTGRQGLLEITVTANGDIILNNWLDVKGTVLGSNIDQKEGAFWSAMIIIISVTFGLFSPMGAIITMLIGLIAVFLLGLFTPLTVTIIIISTVISIVIGFKVRA